MLAGMVIELLLLISLLLYMVSRVARRLRYGVIMIVVVVTVVVGVFVLHVVVGWNDTEPYWSTGLGWAS